MQRPVSWFVTLSLSLTLFFAAGCGEKKVVDSYVSSPGAEDITPVPQTPNCAWWSGLGQQGRNNKIVLEGLYAVQQDYWNENDRVTCDWWSGYIPGVYGCWVLGNWNYCGLGTGKGGQCKPFVSTLLYRASGGAASLPGGTYDYRGWYPYRNRADAIAHALPGEVLQLYGYVNGVLKLHTAVIITNFHDGRFEVVDSNFSTNYDEKIRKHVWNINAGYWGQVDAKSYVIVCGQ